MKRLKQTLSVLGAALVISALGLVSGAAVGDILTPGRILAGCEYAECSGASSCVITGERYNCEGVNPCITEECAGGVE